MRASTPPVLRWLSLLAAMVVVLACAGPAAATPSPTPQPTASPVPPPEPAPPPTPAATGTWELPDDFSSQYDCSLAPNPQRAYCELMREKFKEIDEALGDCGDGWSPLEIACRVNATTNAAAGAVTNPAETVGEAAGWLAKKGLEQLVEATAASAGSLFTTVAGWIFKETAPNLYSPAYAGVYKSVAGVMIALVFLVFLIAVIATVVSPRAEGWGTTLGGLVRAVLGICCAAGITGLMVRLADECTAALLDHYNDKGQLGMGGWAEAMTNLAATPAIAVVALLISALAIIGLLGLAVIMFMRGVMLYAAGIIGAIAMLGQAHPSTRSWARQWFFTITALAWSKFLIAVLWVLGGQLILQSGEKENADSQALLSALSGLALIWMMVYSPFALTRLFSFLDVSTGGLDGSGAGAAMLGKAHRSVGFGAGGESGGGGLSPEQLMNHNLDAGERSGQPSSTSASASADDDTGTRASGAPSGQGSSPDLGDEDGQGPGSEDHTDAMAQPGSGGADGGRTNSGEQSPDGGPGGDEAAGSWSGPADGSRDGGSGSRVPEQIPWPDPPQEGTAQHAAPPPSPTPRQAPAPVSGPGSGGTAGAEIDGGHTVDRPRSSEHQGV